MCSVRARAKALASDEDIETLMALEVPDGRTVRPFTLALARETAHLSLPVVQPPRMSRPGVHTGCRVGHASSEAYSFRYSPSSMNSSGIAARPPSAGP